MGTKLSRIDFRRQYVSAYQGLFVCCNAKRMIKDQPTINIGQKLSDALLALPPDQRCTMVERCLMQVIGSEKAMNLTHIEVLFTPSLHLDVLGVLHSLCRNRKICVHWPGHIIDGKLCYADLNMPEYYEADFTGYVDTFVDED